MTPTMRAFACAALTFMAFIAPAGGAQAALTTLEQVRARGHVVCGVGQDLPGFSQVDAHGVWRGLDVEFCAALAAAVLGKSDAVKYLNLNSSERFKALNAGDVDVLMRASTWTLSRDSELGARFAGVLFHDGQGFMVPRSHSVASVLELSGASICVLPGSSGQRAVEDFFGQRSMRYQLVTSERWEELVKAYIGGSCTVLTGNMSLLGFERSRQADGAKHALLPELIAKDPLGPSVKQGDEEWFSIVRWTLMALIDAEELGISRENIDTMGSSKLAEVRRFLGLEADVGEPLGLARDWAAQVVRQVGNYGEIFERTVGRRSPLQLERGLNATWLNGGLMYAMPFR